MPNLTDHYLTRETWEGPLTEAEPCEYCHDHCEDRVDCHERLAEKYSDLLHELKLAKEQRDYYKNAYETRRQR